MPNKPNLHIMSYREKSAWACLLVTLAVWGPFFFTAAFRRSPPLPATQPGFTTGAAALIAAIALTVCLSVAAHVWIALRSQREPKDERDVAIASRSLRNAYFVLMLSLGTILFTPYPLWTVAAAPGSTYAALLLSFIAAETTRFLSQVVYYRRGWSPE